MSTVIPKKKMLILRATSDACNAEVIQLATIAAMLGMDEPVPVDIKTTQDLADILHSGESYDYLYIAAHGDAEGFCGDELFVSWSQFAGMLCIAPVLNPNAILLLACCRGGLKHVSYTMFASCDKIDYVFGPRWSVTASDITLGFHTFMYNMEDRRLQPDRAAERASKATDFDFLCFDRVEAELTSEYQDRYQAQFNVYPIDEGQTLNTVVGGNQPATQTVVIDPDAA